MKKAFYKFFFELILDNPRMFDLYLLSKSFWKKIGADELFFNNYLKRINAPLKLIQVGANDGLRGDPARKIILKNKCEAILIEADPICFQALKNNYRHLKNRKISFKNVAVFPDTQEQLRFFSLSEEFRKHLPKKKQVILSRKASTNKELLIEYLGKAGFEDPEKLIEAQNVKGEKLNAIFSDYFVPNILIIDTEGLDWKIIESIDFDKYKPDLIYFESKYKPEGILEERVLAKLKKHGYKIEDFGNNIGAKNFNKLCNIKPLIS